MTDTARRAPFVAVGLLVAIASLAVSRLPDTFLSTLARGSPLSAAQADWAFRLLLVAALAQAIYGAFAKLRPEVVARALTRDRKVATMPRARLVTVIARTAAVMVALTLVYGVASLWAGGRRGGFWAFALLAGAQGLWYYRQTGEIARWLARQPAEPELATVWSLYDAAYCPPLARGSTPSRVERP